MSAWEWILYTDISLIKTFIATCTPNKWLHGYMIVVYVRHFIRQGSIYNISIYIYLI